MFIGVSTELFALHAKSVIGIDLWGLEETYNEVSPKTIKDDWQDIEDIARKRLLPYKNTKLIRAFSEDYSKKIKNNSIDMVYIDGSHTYTGVSLDIKCWYDKVKFGGVISGHDYDQLDVKRAIDEFVNDKNLKDLKIFKDTSWSVIK